MRNFFRAVTRSRFPRAACRGALCIALAALAACARPADTVRVPADPAAARETWTRFMNTAARTEASAGPFRLNATLYYSGKEDSQRVTVYSWGNGNKNNPLPLRLDILMGPGSVMAATKEDSRGLFIYVPRDKTVYHAPDGSLLAFDVPVPFSLSDLAYLVTGRYANLFIPSDGEAPLAGAIHGADGMIVYNIDASPLAGNLTVDPNGLPRAWNDGEDWTLDIDYWPDSTRPTPRKLFMKHAGGREATLIVRELVHPEPFSPGQLELAVPPGTRLAPLEVSR